MRGIRSAALIDEADVIVTNPPWSLIREFIPLLAKRKKKFLVIGDQNFITYKEIFEQIMADNLWFGYNNGGTKWFRVPDDYDIATESRKKIIDGVKYFSMGRAYWFTNLDTSKRHESMTLFKRYSPEEYPTYTNYSAIEVSKVAEIPLDYYEEMGVPITFLDKYNPEQFKIIGASTQLAKSMAPYSPKKGSPKGGKTAGGTGRFYLPNDDGTYRRLYERIVVKRIRDQP